MAVQQIVLKNELSNNELAITLKNSLYPGASLDSIQMVLSYCKALKLDPMMKPVHIVKMGDKEVLMPGIGLYRTQALRSGVYAGLSEPEFGPTITEEFREPIFDWIIAKNPDGTAKKKEDGKPIKYKEIVGYKENPIKVSYPEWCKITAKKLVQGKIVEITVIEYWKENYATCGRDSDIPNEMWRKRARGQLAKVAEAQALRKMFPEFVPQQPTYEEMEGKHFENEVIEHEAETIKPASSADSVKQKLKAKLNVEKPIEAMQQEIEPIQLKIKDDTKTHLKFLIAECEVPQTKVNDWLAKSGVKRLDDFKEETAIRIIEKLESNNFEAKQAWVDFVKVRESYNQEQEGAVENV